MRQGILRKAVRGVGESEDTILLLSNETFFFQVLKIA
jgi:hypothetical protein